MAKRILLFGGTFDPVHNGHLIVARAVAEREGYGKLTFVPAASAPHKSPAEASAEDRLAMLRLAIAAEKLFDVCELELNRPGPSYTFDTLCQLRRLEGPEVELHWLIGADMLEELPTWHRAEDVLDIARIVVISRWPWNERLEEILEHLRKKLPAERVELISKSRLTAPLLEISSTEIRRRVRLGMSIRFLTPDSVVSYIHDRRLYSP
ncbi:MAG: nicotinate-nucleotide adenylyltransferase [Planctomycetota bacterium]|jgi:nicotinate-nucleotide adenylyltransferase